MIYPQVTDESSTLDRVLAGASLARYGDGEFNLCEGRGLKCQRFEANLSSRLREILVDAGECLVGIPNIRSATPKLPFWSKYLTRGARFLVDRPYVSSFVTRPDSAPWINTPDYWQRLEVLWTDQDVTLVRGSLRSLLTADLAGAASVREVLAPPLDAWRDYARLMREIGHPSRVLLCVGPTATVMAADLCARGVHAIDIGHVGLFLRKYRRGESMTMSAADHALFV